LAHAQGSFDVNLNPLEPYNKSSEPYLGRMSSDKEFQGDLKAASKGEMLSVTTSFRDSAGYVAVERVSGTLNGKKGSFALIHCGIMRRGSQELSITVVPDSGTEELAGLRGSMSIIIENGKHYYDLDYSFGNVNA
jgi:Protein of unknown function (DUF3224)